EERHARVGRPADDRLGRVLGERPFLFRRVAVAHHAEADARNLQTGPTKPDVFHGHTLDPAETPLAGRLQQRGLIIVTPGTEPIEASALPASPSPMVRVTSWSGWSTPALISSSIRGYVWAAMPRRLRTSACIA